MSEERPYAFEIECRLLRWATSSTAGRTVTLELDPAIGDRHPFDGLRSGSTNGQRFRMMFVPIADDEATPTETEKEARAKKAVVLASLLAKDPKFLTWLRIGRVEIYREAMISAPEATEEEIARQMLRLLCGIDSLARLATDSTARGVFLGIEDQYKVSIGMRAKNPVDN
jgi:hypothetical protein